MFLMSSFLFIAKPSSFNTARDRVQYSSIIMNFQQTLPENILLAYFPAVICESKNAKLLFFLQIRSAESTY